MRLVQASYITFDLSFMSNTGFIKLKQIIAAPSVAALSYGKPASVGTSRDSCGY